MKRPLPKKQNRRKTHGMTIAKFGYVFVKTNLHTKIREFRPGDVAYVSREIAGCQGRATVPVGTRVRVVHCYHVADTAMGPRWIGAPGDTRDSSRKSWGHSQHVRFELRGGIYGKRRCHSFLNCLSGNYLSHKPPAPAGILGRSPCQIIIDEIAQSPLAEVIKSMTDEELILVREAFERDACIAYGIPTELLR